MPQTRHLCTLDSKQLSKCSVRRQCFGHLLIGAAAFKLLVIDDTDHAVQRLAIAHHSICRVVRYD